MIMRLDKYLKTARILKRREAAKGISFGWNVFGSTIELQNQVQKSKIGDQNSFAFWNHVFWK